MSIDFVDNVFDLYHLSICLVKNEKLLGVLVSWSAVYVPGTAHSWP